MTKPGRNRGTKNFRNKLTEKDVLYIFNDKRHTQQKLAEKFGVSQSTINHIKKGLTWGWLTGK